MLNLLSKAYLCRQRGIPMFWEEFLERRKIGLKSQSPGEYYDVAVACHIAAWEGMMYECSRRGDRTQYREYQHKLQILLLHHYTITEMPKELNSNYFPEIKEDQTNNAEQS